MYKAVGTLHLSFDPGSLPTKPWPRTLEQVQKGCIVGVVSLQDAALIAEAPLPYWWFPNPLLPSYEPIVWVQSGNQNHTDKHEIY